MGAELAEAGVVHLAVEGDVVLDLGASVDAVKDVALQVVVDGVVLLQSVREIRWKGRGSVMSCKEGASSAASKSGSLFDVFSTERKVHKIMFFFYVEAMFS